MNNKHYITEYHWSFFLLVTFLLWKEFCLLAFVAVHSWTAFFDIENNKLPYTVHRLMIVAEAFILVCFQSQITKRWQPPDRAEIHCLSVTADVVVSVMPHLQGQESTRSWSSTDWHQSCHYHCLHKSRMLCRIYMAQPAKYARHQTSCREFSSLHVHPVCWWFNDKNKTDLQPYGFGMHINEHLLQTAKSEIKVYNYSVLWCAETKKEP